MEDVIVEADGEWHTSDNKYGSAAWKRAHPPEPAVKLPASPVKTNGTGSSDLNGKKKVSVEIVVLDSDDEDDEGQVKRELSPSFGSGSSVLVPPSESPSLGAESQSQTDVIDLTLDSDEEDLPPSSRTAEKRKVMDNGIPSPTEQIWKKSRVESIAPMPNLKSVNGQHVNGVGVTNNLLNGALSPNTLSTTHRPFYDPLRSDLMRDLPPPYVTGPPLSPGVPSGGRYSSSEMTYHSFLGDSPPLPPRRHPSTSSGGQLASRPGGRDFYSNGSSSRWS